MTRPRYAMRATLVEVHVIINKLTKAIQRKMNLGRFVTLTCNSNDKYTMSARTIAIKQLADDDGGRRTQDTDQEDERQNDRLDVVTDPGR